MQNMTDLKDQGRVVSGSEKEVTHSLVKQLEKLTKYSVETALWKQVTILIFLST
jgi:hypothetical protein